MVQFIMQNLYLTDEISETHDSGIGSMHFAQIGLCYTVLPVVIHYGKLDKAIGDLD